MQTTTVLRLLVSLIILLAAIPADALTVTIGGILKTQTEMINNKLSIRIEGPYGNFTIARCSGCAGPARVFVDDGPSVDKLTMTDALITYSATATGPGTLTIMYESSDYAPLSAGTYPYSAAMAGCFMRLGGAAPVNDIAAMSAWANGNLIKQPTSDNNSPSLRHAVSSATTACWPPPTSDSQVSENIPCGQSPGVCQPNLRTSVDLTFNSPGDSLRWPGSAHALGAVKQEDMDKALRELIEHIREHLPEP